MEHAIRLLAAALHYMWKDVDIVVHAQGGLSIPKAERFQQSPDSRFVPFFTWLAPGVAYFGLFENGTYTGLLGRDVGGGKVVYAPVPHQGPRDQLVADAPNAPFPPVSADPTSPYLLGPTLSESAPMIVVGSTAFGQDLERLTMGMALDALGLAEGKIRALLQPVVAPFYGRCVVEANTLRFTSQGCAWHTESNTRSVDAALDRALCSLMVAHGVDAGHLAVAPTSHFKGHMLLAMDTRLLSAHARLDVVGFWRHHSA